VGFSLSIGRPGFCLRDDIIFHKLSVPGMLSAAPYNASVSLPGLHSRNTHKVVLVKRTCTLAPREWPLPHGPSHYE
jgi:hypothetical protein